MSIVVRRVQASLGAVDRIPAWAYEVIPQLIGACFCANDLHRDYTTQVNGILWWIAWDGQRPVGFGGLTVEQGVARLHLAGVLPAYRRQGIGQRLVKARLAAARRLGCSKVLTYTWRHNLASQANLLKAGFVQDPTPGTYLDFSLDL